MYQYQMCHDSGEEGWQKVTRPQQTLSESRDRDARARATSTSIFSAMREDTVTTSHFVPDQPKD